MSEALIPLGDGDLLEGDDTPTAVVFGCGRCGLAFEYEFPKTFADLMTSETRVQCPACRYRYARRWP